MNRTVARQRYASQKAHAAKRGIAWEMTFDEWCEIWDGRLHLRGPRKDQLVMCRTQDQGSYRPDNVRLDSPRGNAADRKIYRRRTWTSKMCSLGHPEFFSESNHFLRPDKALEAAQEAESESL